MAGGDQHDQLIGRQGHVQVRASNGRDLVFLGQGAIASKKGFAAYPTSSWAVNPPAPPSGQFYRLVGQKLVPIKTPKLRLVRKDIVRVGTRDYPMVQN
jgi:hypothetical protein